MFVPGTGASAPAAPIAPIELLGSHGASAAQPPLGAPARERVQIRRQTLNVLAGHAIDVAGALRPHLRGAKITMQLLLGRRWVTVARTHTGARGRFRLRYVPGATGSWRAQVRYQPAGGEQVTRRLGAISAFRAVEASWYGGGGGLACGGELTSATMGVANKTLPCGTWLTLRYGDHNVRVQVIDRGPYVAGREFDLTEATKRALGFEGVGVVWATR
jgi:rare lipoprotein A